MSGENMLEDVERVLILDRDEYLDYIERMLKKTFEDLLEAYFRTPPHVSSKKYVYRALRRIQNALSYTHVYRYEHNRILRESK